MNTTKNRSAARPGQLTLSLTTPILTAAQQAARPDRETRLAAAHAVLARGLSGVRDDPAALAAYLAFAAHFHDYSPRNTLLIYMQRPTAQFCKGFRAWQSVGRRVRKGERGLTVFAPIVARSKDKAPGTTPGTDDEKVLGFRTATTFDYEQTEAVAEGALVYTPPTPRLDREAPDGLVTRLEAAAQAAGFTVVYTELGYADGWCRFSDRTIMVRAALTGADRASVLTHELAHAIMHEFTCERPSKASMELQAEGAAYTCLAALGLDTARAALPYLRGWSGEDSALMAELQAIDRIARDLLARIDA